MTIQTINLGNVVNDGLGDDLRTAFTKVNANFSSLSAELTTTIGSASTSGISLFKEKVGSELVFKTLVSGTKMLLDDTGNTVIVNNTAPDAFFRFDTNSGSIIAGSGNNGGQITIQGGNDIDVTAFGPTITINNVIPVTDILTTFDFGPIGNPTAPGVDTDVTAHYQYSTQLALASANIDFGTITLEGRIGLDCGTLG